MVMGGGHAARTGDEPPAAGYQSRETGDNEQERFPQSPRRGALLLRVGLFPVGCPERVDHVADEEPQQQNAFPAGDGSACGVLPEGEAETHDQQYQRDEHVVGDVDTLRTAADADGLYEGGRTEDEQRVGEVRADDVADGHASLVFDAGDEAHHEFRQRGADPHDGESDEKFGHAVAFGHRYRAVDQRIGPDDDQHQAENK